MQRKICEKEINEKYPELKGICRYCLGCNQLENIDFEGVYKCENYVKGEMKC